MSRARVPVMGSTGRSMTHRRHHHHQAGSYFPIWRVFCSRRRLVRKAGRTGQGCNLPAAGTGPSASPDCAAAGGDLARWDGYGRTKKRRSTTSSCADSRGKFAMAPCAPVRSIGSKYLRRRHRLAKSAGFTSRRLLSHVWPWFTTSAASSPFKDVRVRRP